MTFETPEIVEIKMDAEVGSYQEDREPEDPLVEDARAA
jgi:hypothetical protein